MRLEQRVVVVTGGSSGIGRAIALRFADEAAHVVVGDVTHDPREGGETTEEDWDAIMAVNLRGVFLCCRRAIGEMVEQEPIGEARGRLIIVSSQHGMIGPPGHFAYAVSKGGLVNMAHQLAVDYARRGVFVNAIAPGKILTGSPEQQSPETLAYSHARTPFPRLGRPEDVAGAALFLASDDSGYVSGVNLLVDGGWMAY